MNNNHGHLMSSSPSAIIFDLDGTLVDSARDLTGALNHVLRQARRPKIDISKVRDMVGDGAKALIIKGFSETGSLPSEADMPIIWQDFLDYYLENITRETIVFPGALSVIKELKAKNIPMGLCTNKVIKLTHKLMTEIGLADYFSAIVGGDSFDYRKPDPRHITSTLEQMQCDPTRAIMVGDSANDIIAAQKANIPVIAVSFGYSKDPVSTLNPDVVIDHYDQFLEKMSRISQKL